MFAVASEMRPLLRVVPAKPDEDALAELLTFGWAAGAQSNLVGIERISAERPLKFPWMAARPRVGASLTSFPH